MPLATHLAHIDFLDETVERLSQASPGVCGRSRLIWSGSSVIFGGTWPRVCALVDTDVGPDRTYRHHQHLPSVTTEVVTRS